MKKQILFVTNQNDDIEDALSYSVDLAKAMDEVITVLVVSRKKLLDKFNDVMAAVGFAEADDHKTARDILARGNAQNSVEDYLKKFKDEGVSIKVLKSTKDAVPAVTDLLKQKNNVDMVLLSPGITSNGEVTTRELHRLVRTASRPIVTMAKNAYAV
jgi:UDP-N-acetylmuramoylalanine-D-glutamate ligase